MGKGTHEIAENTIDVTKNMDSTFAYNRKTFQKGPQGDPNESGTDVPGSKDLAELYEESLRRIHEGEVVKGEIVQVDEKHVLVDIGYKSEGQIPTAEFIDSEGNQTARIGDKLDVLLERMENKDGRVILSKEKAAKIKIWSEIEQIHRKIRTVTGKILFRVKGGYCVDIGLRAFLPGSQVDLSPVRDVDALVGTEHDFRILKYDKRKRNVVVSRRAVLEAERTALRKKTLERIEEGTVLTGTVKNITDYGLFIDLGGIDGLCHASDISWGGFRHPSEIHHIGDKITVKVLKFHKEEERICLGIKQLTPDPWTTVEGKYAVGTKLKGRVVGMKDYGAFVEVQEGVQGLLHVSELSWTRKIRDPSQVLNLGDIVEVVVLRIDSAKKRIALGMRQVEPNPWDTISEKYPIGTTIEGNIKNITSFGLFVGIDDGIDGLVHISNISWTKRIKHPSEVYETGQVVRAVVLNIDKEKRHFSLGIKQLTPDPWDEVPEKYPCGIRVAGTVTSVTDFGVFVELEKGIEGLVHVSELPSNDGQDPLSRFEPGDKIQAKVTDLSPEHKRIRLSVRSLAESCEKVRTQIAFT
jgi:small subunit ribosomal protein S1